MAKTVKDTYSEILKLRNEFYQKWQDAPQYDENRDAYRAKYEAFDKALELLTPSIVDPQPEDSGELTLSVTKMSDQEEPISEDLLDEIHNRWEDDPHTKWPKCPYKDFKNIAFHFANWQKKQDADLGSSAYERGYHDEREYEKGKADIKKELLKDAITTEIVNGWEYGKDEDHAKIPTIHIKGGINFSIGDKVRVIIIKED